MDRYRYTNQELHEKAVKLYEEIQNIKLEDLKGDPVTKNSLAYREYKVIKVACSNYLTGWDRKFKEQQEEEERKQRKIAEIRAIKNIKPFLSVLETGMYGIPFKASINDILKWCNQSGMTVNNNTKAGITKLLRELAKGILPKSHQLKQSINTASLDKLDAAITKYSKEIMQPYEGLGGIYDPQLNALLNAIKIYQDTYKVLGKINRNEIPMFRFNNKTYFMTQTFEKVNCSLTNGKELELRSKDLVERKYQLSIIPTAKQGRMKYVEGIDVYFYKNDQDKLESYASIVVFGQGDSSRNDIDEHKQMIIKALTDKYGIPFEGAVEENGGNVYPKVDYELLYILSGLEIMYDSGKRVMDKMWGKDIFFIDVQESSYSDPDHFLVIHCDRNYAASLKTQYNTALDKEVKQYLEKKDKTYNAIKNDI